MGYFVGQVGHLGSQGAAPVRGFLTEAAGPVDISYEPVERGWVSRNESPQKNPEEHVFRKRVFLARQGQPVRTTSRPTILGDAGGNVPSRFLNAGESQEGVEQNHVALRRPMLGATLTRKAQALVAPGLRFLC